MAKLYFRYGVMGSSKTANALMTRFNYEEKGMYAWVIKPSIDNRDDTVDETGRRVSVIKSRIGLSAPVELVRPEDNIIAMYDNLVQNVLGYDAAAIIVDECQFMTEEQISQLVTLVHKRNIPVLCYGLRTDFQTKLFPGSRRLMEVADIIEQVKHVCQCGSAAQINARLDPMGNVITEGDQVAIGGNEMYEAMCWKCYMKNTLSDEIVI